MVASHTSSLDTRDRTRTLFHLICLCQPNREWVYGLASLSGVAHLLMKWKWPQLARFCPTQQKTRFLQQVSAGDQNIKGLLNFFLLSYLVYSQISRNLSANDHQFGYITKLEKKKKKKTVLITFVWSNYIFLPLLFMVLFWLENFCKCHWGGFKLRY